jgi:hypothetical protein
MVNEFRVRSWAELNERLFEGSWQPGIGRYRSNFAFRGTFDARDNLRTSLLKGGFAPQESHLLRNFRKYAHKGESPGGSVWNWLALAQHHGLPTRLLDWTYSPFVALHFATALIDYADVDGAVWCVDYVRTNEVLPNRLRELLRNEGSNVFTAEMLDAVANNLPAFDGLARDEFVVFFEPPSLDDRIVNQFALFSLMSSPTAVLDQWLERFPDLWRRIVLPAQLKWEIRDKLDQANITERVLFPGLDGLTRWLKRYYSPKEHRAGIVPESLQDDATDAHEPMLRQ